MTKAVVWEGRTIGLVIEPEGGQPYLVCPIVYDEEGKVVMGAAVLDALTEAGAPILHPVIRDCGPAGAAELERQLARVRDELGIESYAI